MTTRTVNRGNPRAVYDQIAQVLVREIQTRHPPGSQLSSEALLAARFAVNRHTVRHAIDVLVGLGMVERRHGIGTFVLDQPVEYPVTSHTRFTENLLALGKAADSRLLRRVIIPASRDVSRALQLPGETDVLTIDTLRIVDGRPFGLITHSLPVPRFNGLLLGYDGGSLHACLQDMYRLKPVRVRTVISAQAPTDEDASALLIPRTTPILRISAVNVDGQGLPIEHSLARMRADRMQLAIDHPSPDSADHNPNGTI